MNYHNITKDDMLNGDGLRVVLWVAGCSHHCKGCQNPVTWDPADGVPFTGETYAELVKELNHDYISGLTLSGGDPLFQYNRTDIITLVELVKQRFPDKTIWCYTGFTWEECFNDEQVRKYILPYIDVLVDGRYIETQRDVNLHWRGSKNQRVIKVQETLKTGVMTLLTEE